MWNETIIIISDWIDKEEVHPMNDWDVFIVWDVFIIGFESNHTECVFGLIFKSIFLACVN